MINHLANCAAMIIYWHEVTVKLNHTGRHKIYVDGSQSLESLIFQTLVTCQDAIWQQAKEGYHHNMKWMPVVACIRPYMRPPAIIIIFLMVASVKSDKRTFLNVKKWNTGKRALKCEEGRLKIVKTWTKMTLKCEVSFFKCDKCEVKYSW